MTVLQCASISTGYARLIGWIVLQLTVHTKRYLISGECEKVTPGGSWVCSMAVSRNMCMCLVLL